MKLCIFTNHFYPEDFKVNDIAFEFAKKGCDITVITAIPDYPQGKYYQGYSLFKRRKEIVNNVKVIRLPIVPRGKGKSINLILNYVSYFISAFVFTCFHALTNKYDAVFVHLTSPFFIGLPAVLLKRRQRIPLVLWVLDLWPESLIAGGGINNRHILNSQIKLVRYTYDNCDKILIGSQGFKKSICEKGDYAAKIVYFPNWAEAVNLDKSEQLDPRQFKRFFDIVEKSFVILFAGNLGEAQNIECVIHAAEKMKSNTAIKFIFLGEGRRKDNLQQRAEQLGLSETVFFLGRYPLETMPVFMQRADVLLVSLKDEPIFNLTVPQKVQFYMSQGRPILAMLNGDGAELVNGVQCGIAVPANDEAALRYAIEKFQCMSKEELTVLGINGKQYYQKNFTKEQRIGQLSALLDELIHH
jgi:glycosyltransferase involved in cell wall biosynthesis